MIDETFWIPSDKKPDGWEREVFLRIVWPEGMKWNFKPDIVVGWWKHGPSNFAFQEFENADHLVTHWAEIPSYK